MDSLLRDVRHAERTMREAPGCTVVVVLTMALGSGANTALFSTIDAALLRDIPYADPDRLVAGDNTGDGLPVGPVSRLDFYGFRDAAMSFDGVAAHLAGEPDGDPREGVTPFLSGRCRQGSCGRVAVPSRSRTEAPVGAARRTDLELERRRSNRCSPSRGETR